MQTTLASFSRRIKCVLIDNKQNVQCPVCNESGRLRIEKRIDLISGNEFIFERIEHFDKDGNHLEYHGRRKGLPRGWRG